MSSVVAQWPVRMIAAPVITSKAPKTFSPRAMITGSLLAPSTLLLPVDDAGRQDARSPAALQLLGYASAAQRAAGVSRLVSCGFFGSSSRKIASHLARATPAGPRPAVCLSGLPAARRSRARAGAGRFSSPAAPE